MPLENPVTLALCAAFSFALALILTQFGLRHLAARQGALVALPGMTVALWLLAGWFLDRDTLEPRGVLIFITIGLFFPGIVTLLTFEANRRMGPAVAGALGNLAPLFAVPMAAVSLGELPDLGQGIGMAAIMLGVLVLSLSRRGPAGAWPLWTAALPLAAAAIRGFSQSGIKLGLATSPSPFAAILLGYSTSCAVIVAANLLHRDRQAPRFSAAGVLWFAAVGLANGAAVMMMYAALGRGPVILVSPLVSTYPLITLFLTAAFLRTARIDAALVAGVVLTVAGVGVLIAA